MEPQELQFNKKCAKRGYFSKKKAKAALRLMNKNQKRGLTDVYFCEICSQWHTTSLDKLHSRDITHRKEAKKNKTMKR